MAPPYSCNRFARRLGSGRCLAPRALDQKDERDDKAAELLSRQKVIAFLAAEGLLGPDRIDLLGEPFDRTESPSTSSPVSSCTPTPDQVPSSAERKRLRRKWAQLIRRIYEADPLLCECRQKMRIISVLTDQPVIDKIIAHLNRKRFSTLPSRPLEPRLDSSIHGSFPSSRALGAALPRGKAAPSARTPHHHQDIPPNPVSQLPRTLVLPSVDPSGKTSGKQITIPIPIPPHYPSLREGATLLHKDPE